MGGGWVLKMKLKLLKLSTKLKLKLKLKFGKNKMGLLFVCVPYLKFLYKYLGTGRSDFQTDLFIETVGLF